MSEWLAKAFLVWCGLLLLAFFAPLLLIMFDEISGSDLLPRSMPPVLYPVQSITPVATAPIVLQSIQERTKLVTSEGLNCTKLEHVGGVNYFCERPR